MMGRMFILVDVVELLDRRLGKCVSVFFSFRCD